MPSSPDIGHGGHQRPDIGHGGISVESQEAYPAACEQKQHVQMQRANTPSGPACCFADGNEFVGMFIITVAYVVQQIYWDSSGNIEEQHTHHSLMHVVMPPVVCCHGIRLHVGVVATLGLLRHI
jgi:hypothetical protein